MKRIISLMLLAIFTFAITACSPEVGSEGWCKQMKEKSKGDWTANETTDYAKHCIFK